MIASILPVHSIVAAVMGETGTPELLLPGRLSEHAASFTAAQIASLGKADVVFIVGKVLEAKLARIGGSEAVAGRGFVELSLAPGIHTMPVRAGGNWEADAHDAADPDDPAEGVLAFDPHIWLDPENAKAMAAAIALELARVAPANAAAYQTNARNFENKIDALSAEVGARLAPVAAKPFIVFHDAFQYFEKRFRLRGVGAITDVSAAPPSARRIKEIRDKLTASGAVCVFREPQFDSKFVDTVIEGSRAKPGILDPVGAGLTPGPDAYSQLIRNITADLSTCLGS